MSVQDACEVVALMVAQEMVKVDVSTNCGVGVLPLKLCGKALNGVKEGVVMSRTQFGCFNMSSVASGGSQEVTGGGGLVNVGQLRSAGI